MSEIEAYESRLRKRVAFFDGWAIGDTLPNMAVTEADPVPDCPVCGDITEWEDIWEVEGDDFREWDERYCLECAIVWDGDGRGGVVDLTRLVDDAWNDHPLRGEDVGDPPT